MVSGKAKRLSTGTDALQIAKQKLRDFESAQARGTESLLPTRTPIPTVLSQYVQHIRSAKTAKSAQTDIYYLRDVFGAVCEELRVTSRKVLAAIKKRPAKSGQDRRRKAPVIECSHFEAITTAQISAFIAGQMASRGLAPKTGNRIRDTLSGLFSWAMTQRGIQMPGRLNPVTAVVKYKEPAPEIEFLTLEQIDQQLKVLSDNPRLQVMVAILIFAGIRREELLWLTSDDIDLNAGTYGLIRIRSKTVNGESWTPKTKKNRGVFISQKLSHYLTEWKPSKGKSPWLFPSATNGRLDPDNFSRTLRVANKAKGLAWTQLHYRHTFGSQLARRGESLFKIAKLMGNSPQIAERHYAALLPESLVTAVEF